LFENLHIYNVKGVEVIR